MNYASDEEGYFALWIEELQTKGLIKSVKYQPKSFILSNPIEFEYTELLKTKSKLCKITLLQNHEYTADFLIYWNKIVDKKMFIDWNSNADSSYKKFPFITNYSERTGEHFSVVDVKGTFNQNDAWRRFAIDQKWVFQKHGIYVQKIIIHPQVTKKGKMIPANALFPRTFIPKRFQLTATGKFKRKIKYNYKLIDEYLTEIGINV